MKVTSKLVTLSLLGVSSLTAAAQPSAYPDRPVKLLVGFPAGQATDLVARVITEKLWKNLKQPFVVENKPGQGGSIGLAALAKSPADGYTMALVATASLVSNPHLYKSVGYDALKDFTPSAMLAEIPLVLVAYPLAPFDTVAQLIKHAKDRPGKVNYSSPGNGTMSHLAMERMSQEAGISLLHVPYQGSVRSLTDLIAGIVTISFDTLSVTVPHIEGKRLKPLAVASLKRSPLLPYVPTMAEAGLTGFVASPWLGVVFPRGTPAEIVNKMHGELVKVMDDAGVQQSLQTLGVVPRVAGPQEFARVIEQDNVKWGRIVKEAGIKID